MWNLSTSFILVVFMTTGITNSLCGQYLSLEAEKFEENLSLKFTEPMDNCYNTEHEVVKLVNTKFNTMKDNFIASDYVRSIILENNKIVDISPNAFNAVPNLSCLNIRRNNISNIFDNFLASFNHTALKKLNLAHTAFNKSFYDNTSSVISNSKTLNGEYSKPFLPNLTHLDISDNKLKELPIYLNFSFPRLTHLYMSDNELNSDTFNRIPATTQYLYLERNHGFINVSSFPENIYALILNENSNITWNIEPFREYPNLRILSLRNTISYRVYNLFIGLKKLADLDISSNNISNIDEFTFKNATSLKRLSLDQNDLNSLPFLAPLNSLTDLSIAYNKIFKIMRTFFANQYNLKTLNLRGNLISLIEKDAFSNLIMLEKLDLSENHLMTIYESWMKPLKSLKYLNLKTNLFDSLDNMKVDADSKLTNLFVEHNIFKLTNISTIFSLPSTVVLHLSSMYSSKCSL
ncbi:hypothetical protein M0802_002790 [Mischocyttarus mexicanus]|nr:hypothetical protein M0802_002790 [Mischocyttarus mexicanus]